MLSPFSRYSRLGLKLLAVLALLAGLLTGMVAPALANRPVPITYERSGWVSIGSNRSTTLYWSCPRDRYTVGGGFETEAISGNSAAGFKMIHNYPKDYRTWEIRLRNTDDVARRVKIYNVCVKTSDF